MPCLCLKYTKVLLMYLGYLLFELLVFTLFCIAMHSLNSAFTFPFFQSSSILDKCFWLMVFEVLFEDVYSSKFGSNIKLFKAVVLDGLLDIQHSINFVISSTNCLSALFDGMRKIFFFQKTICSYVLFTAFSYPLDDTLLILFVLFSAAQITMVLDSKTSSSNLLLSSSKLFLQLLSCIFNPLVGFTIFLHKLPCIVSLSLGDSNDIF